MDGRSLRNAARKGVIASRASDAAPLSLPRACRLVHRAEYDAVYSEGRRRTSRELTVFLRPNGLEVSRFGWSIKKALGNAVRRNRIRRRLREILRLHRGEIAQGWDIVIHPRSSAATAEFLALKDELLKLLPRAEQAQNREAKTPT
ncbi:MAG TPA: ribonuclease P protein component [Candidatus Acidoferrales bacterium]|nr:ribonuclease P protein component [Candidatus Acidoferrales bacterium]